MTVYEIVQMYKEAKDKNAQIEILADMNMCSKEDILLVLQNEGLISGVKGKKTKAEKPVKRKTQKETFSWDEEAKERVRKLLREGLSVLEVSERMGLNYSQVRNAVTNYNLRECKIQNTECEAEGSSGLFKGTKGARIAEESEEPITEPVQSCETKGQYTNALDTVSLIRDYARCVTALPSSDIRNYEKIVKTFCESIIEGADRILEEGAKYGA